MSNNSHVLLDGAAVGDSLVTRHQRGDDFILTAKVKLFGEVILNKYQLEMLDTKMSLSMAIYEYFSGKEIADSENILSKRYELSFNSWDKLIKYGISRDEFKQVDVKGVFDLLLFSYQGVRMYSQLMSIQKETPIRITR